DFFLTEVPAAVGGGEVEEPEADGLLELVGERPGEEHDGDVRLPDGDRIDRVRVGGRVGEVFDEAAGVVHGYGKREGVCSAGDVSSKIPRVPERCRSGRSGRSRKPLYGQP